MTFRRSDQEASAAPAPFRRGLRLAMWGAAVVALVWLWVGSQRIRLTPPGRALPASSIPMRDSEGRRFDLADLRGQVVLVNLWASWCGPCRAEVPRLARIHRDLSGRGLVVLGLNQEGFSPAEMETIRREWDIPYPVVVPLAPLAGTSFEGEGVIPYNWLIDTRGRVRASRAGLVSEKSLRVAIEALLVEAMEQRSDASTGSGIDASVER